MQYIAIWFNRKIRYPSTKKYIETNLLSDFNFLIIKFITKLQNCNFIQIVNIFVDKIESKFGFIEYNEIFKYTTRQGVNKSIEYYNKLLFTNETPEKLLNSTELNYDIILQ